jgi:hypothetical protein
MALDGPPSVQFLLESFATVKQQDKYPLLGESQASELSVTPSTVAANFTPRTLAFTKVIDSQKASNGEAHSAVEAIISAGVHLRMLETFPEALNCILKEWIVQCQASPRTTWPSSLLTYVSRDDLNLLIYPQIPSSSDGGYFKVNEMILILYSKLTFPDSHHRAATRPTHNQSVIRGCHTDSSIPQHR